MRWIREWRERRSLRRNNIYCAEGHLGGYIRSSPVPAPSGLQIRNGDPQTYTPQLWRWAVERLGVRSVIDIGCGEGHAALFFRQLGCDVLAVDGSLQAERDSVIADAHVRHDFIEGPLQTDRTFDLAWCCEFVEHVEERFAVNFLTTFEAAGIVMLAHAVPGQPGWHHVNCQTAEYWVDRMSDHGFVFDKDLTHESRALSSGKHYRKRGLLFLRREGAP